MKENRRKDGNFQQKKGISEINQMVILDLENYNIHNYELNVEPQAEFKISIKQKHLTTAGKWNIGKNLKCNQRKKTLSSEQQQKELQPTSQIKMWARR